MDYKFWIAVIGTVAQIAVGLWGVTLQKRALLEVQTRSERRRGERWPWYKTYWPVLAMAACMVGTWVPYFTQTCPVIQSPTGYIAAYGLTNFANPTARVEAQSKYLMSESKDHKLAAVCFHYSGMGDILDATGLQKSGLYDITEQDASILIPLDGQFMAENRQGQVGTNYRLLLVPNSIKMSQFSTLHEAQALGIRIVGQSAGPP